MESLDLAARLGPAFAAAFAERGYTTLTSVQEAALDPEVASCDLRISSQTGSGKTVAIGFALRSHVDGDVTPGDGGVARPAALVIVPTRELARQVEQELAWLYAKEGRRVASVTGGASYRDERRALGSGPAIVVGTPGRLLDQLSRGAIDPAGVRAVALDEADRMLDMGFKPAVDRIVAKTPKHRQTLFFSATLQGATGKLAAAYTRDARRHTQAAPEQKRADIEHRFFHFETQSDKFDRLVEQLRGEEGGRTLVFVRTKRGADRLVKRLRSREIDAAAMHGDKNQRQRERALARFEAGEIDALVATDVAARGIDVADITHVVNFDAPGDRESYVHRVGRTGRAGQRGTGISFVLADQADEVRRMAGALGLSREFDQHHKGGGSRNGSTHQGQRSRRRRRPRVAG